MKGFRTSCHSPLLSFPCRKGGLRQAAVRRAEGRPRLSLPLHPPRRHLELASDPARQQGRHLHMEGLSRPRQGAGQSLDQADNARCRRVHSPLSPARAAERLSSHPPLRLPRQPRTRRDHRSPKRVHRRRSGRAIPRRFRRPAGRPRSRRRATLAKICPCTADACASSRPSPAAPSPEASRPNPPESTHHDRRPDPHAHRRSSPDDTFRRPSSLRIRANRRGKSPPLHAKSPSNLDRPSRTPPPLSSAAKTRPRRRRRPPDPSQNPHRSAASPASAPSGPRFPPLAAFGRRPQHRSLHRRARKGRHPKPYTTPVVRP